MAPPPSIQARARCYPTQLSYDSYAFLIPMSIFMPQTSSLLPEKVPARASEARRDETRRLTRRKSMLSAAQGLSFRRTLGELAVTLALGKPRWRVPRSHSLLHFPLLPAIALAFPPDHAPVLSATSPIDRPFDTLSSLGPSSLTRMTRNGPAVLAVAVVSEMFSTRHTAELSAAPPPDHLAFPDRPAYASCLSRVMHTASSCS